MTDGLPGQDAGVVAERDAAPGVGDAIPCTGAAPGNLGDAAAAQHLLGVYPGHGFSHQWRRRDQHGAWVGGAQEARPQCRSNLQFGFRSRFGCLGSANLWSGKKSSGLKSGWAHRLQAYVARSRACKLRGGPKISRKMIASRKPDFDASKIATSVLRSALLGTPKAFGTA